MFHKATQGLALADPQFGAFMAGFKGMQGAYHFGTAADPVKQADFFYDTVAPLIQPNRPVLLALDLENNPDATSGTMSILGAEKFIARLKARAGVQPGIYTRAGILPDVASTLSACWLWVANENTPPTLPSQWKTWAFQQYAFKAAPGTIHEVDTDRFNGSLDALHTFWQGNGVSLKSPVQQLATRYVIADPNVNIRAEASAESVDIGDLQYGEQITVDLTTVTNHYVKLVGRDGWVSTEWISDTAPVPVTPPTPTTTPITLPKTSLMGFHSWGPGGWLVRDLCAKAAVNGTPIPLVVVFRQGWDKEMTSDDIKAVSPKTVTIERISPGGQNDALRLVDAAGVKWSWNDSDLYQVGRKMLELYVQAYPSSASANYIQIMNEPVVVNALGTVSCWEGILDAAEAHGLHMAVLCTPVGWPALPTEPNRIDRADSTFWTRPETANLMRHIIRGGHALVVHAYRQPDPGGPWDSAELTRVARGIAYLPADCRSVPVFFAEFLTYVGAELGTDDYMTGVKTSEMLVRHSGINVKGMALWVIGDYHEQGHASDITRHSGAILTYQQTTRF